MCTESLCCCFFKCVFDQFFPPRLKQEGEPGHRWVGGAREKGRPTRRGAETTRRTVREEGGGEVTERWRQRREKQRGEPGK